MTDAFVPLSPTTLPKVSNAAPVVSAVNPTADAAAFGAVQAVSADPSRSPDCSKPVVTLQRNGDIVTGIRVQCGCGKVIELNCLY